MSCKFHTNPACLADIRIYHGARCSHGPNEIFSCHGYFPEYWAVVDSYGICLMFRRSAVRACLQSFILRVTSFTQNLDCVGDKVYTMTVFTLQKCTFLHTTFFTTCCFTCSSCHTSLWENNVYKIVCSFSISKLLGHSCVGVLDIQVQCAVVTLVS